MRPNLTDERVVAPILIDAFVKSRGDFAEFVHRSKRTISDNQERRLKYDEDDFDWELLYVVIDEAIH